MTAIVVEKNITEKREKRAKSIAAMGLVNRENDKFRVSTPSLRGRQTSYQVWRDAAGKIRCNCLEFEEAVVTDPAFRCEHILAVKYALVAQNTEPAAKQPIKVTTEIKIVSEDKSATESPDSGLRNADRGFNESEIRKNPEFQIPNFRLSPRMANRRLLKIKRMFRLIDKSRQSKPTFSNLRTHKEKLI